MYTCKENMSGKEITMEDLDESMKQTEEQLDLLSWKMDGSDQTLAVPIDNQNTCVVNLLKSVSELLGCTLTGAQWLSEPEEGVARSAGAAAGTEQSTAGAADARSWQICETAPEVSCDAAALNALVNIYIKSSQKRARWK